MMNVLILTLAGLVGAYFALRWFATANVRAVLASGRFLGLALGVAVAAVLALTGRIGLAIPLIALIVTLYGRGYFTPVPSRTRRAPGERQRSMVRSAALEMELDHDTGRMSGRVLAGTFEGRDLDTLDMPAIHRLAREIGSDPESRALLEAYLDRRLPGWREDVKADAGPSDRRTANAGAMSEEEAYQILGLQKGAGEPEIRAAHRRLMKKVHPDYGGSTFLAARINEAKDRLLSKHR